MAEEEKKNLTSLTGHMELTDMTPIRHQAYESESDDDSEYEMSRDSLTHTYMTSTHFNVTSSNQGEVVGGNPKNWEWGEVQKWLSQKGLSIMKPVFEQGATDKDGTDGPELLGITLNKLFDDAGHYQAGEKLGIPSIEEAENSPIFEKFFRELTKLQLKANESSSNDFTEKEASINDVIEMKRRIYLFIEKWDRILWIEGYVDTNNGKLPTNVTISEELGVSQAIAEVYLHYFENSERVKKKDVDELLLDFNVYNDCVIWWFVIVQILTTVQTKAIWLLFNKVAELTPGNVAIELLDRYKFDLTRFDAEKLEQLGQNIVIGSQYPICASLRMSKWFMDIAHYDVARSHIFEGVSESFVDAAFDYLNLVESDHMATIILECKSDIEGMSAMDMALDFQLSKFVSDQRIERITTSIMNDFEFLRPRNQDEAFQIDPLSVKLIWRKMFYTQFYFTPLGTYCVEVLLYCLYLMLFTALSVQQFRVFDPMSRWEFVFWIFNAGFVSNELQNMFSSGLKQYFSEPQNYFDSVISGLFVASIVIRLWALFIEAPCDEPPVDGIECWAGGHLNTIFVILWGLATITLWLRIINFAILSHSLGPMVTMIFKMMADIATFFEIMIILFLAFAFCLMFILGDVLDEFATPTLAAITLFRALLGDFEFENLAEAEGLSPGLLYFAYGVMLLYLVIGSLVLLNLLIAMMAKTFDTIEEDTTSAIIFARFRLALDRDTTASLMPPPLNILAMLCMIFFYLFEFVVNILKRCLGCYCCGKKDYIPFDFAVSLMPQFMKERKLELDEQILYENCGKFWTIITNKGPTMCKIIKYKPEIGDHYVRFYADDCKKGIKVSVGNSVEKKHQWQLDLFDLHRDGLVDFGQFNNVYVTAEWTHKAHEVLKEMKHQHSKSKSPYWVCGFCRGYVKGSKISIKRLGYMMHVSDIEMKIVTKTTPDICPNCYRVRLERVRSELIWEIISYWIYRFIVAPMLFAIIFVIILFGLIKDPDELARAIEMVKSKLTSTRKEAASVIHDTGDVIGDLLDDGQINYSNKEDDGNTMYQAREKHAKDPKYVAFHYSDTQLISNMNEWDEDNTMFDVAIRDDVWELLADAKNDIDVFLLREKINNHIMFLSTEEELTPYEFYDNFINMNGLRKNGGDFLWNEYFMPLAKTMFSRVQKLRESHVPLHLFRRYPFDIQLVMDDFNDHINSKENFDKQLKDLNADDIVDALQSLQSLNCSENEQRYKLLKAIKTAKDDVWEKHHEDTLFTKFTRYMSEVQKLFQDTRTIKNMLRDVSTAIVERGADSSVFLDQLHFLFEDLRNVTLATPFFNSMRTDNKRGEKKVELWTIRNTLNSLYFLNSVTRKYILQKHSRLYVTKQNLLDMVYKLFVHDIIDPEGITDFIHTDDHDEEPPNKQDMSRLYSDQGDAYTESATKSFLYAQKSTVAIGAQFEEHEDEDKMDEEQRHQIILERMELFQKGAITASAVRDEVSSIFDKIQRRRYNKITESSIDYYRRYGLKSCRLLQDDETLRYMFEQLSRFATFYPKQMKEKCSVDLLRRIFYNTLIFGDDESYGIDDETMPKMIKEDRYIQQLYSHLYELYHDTEFSSIIEEQTLKYMTLEDVLSMIMLYERSFSTLKTKIVEDGDLFVVTHDVFCKFVDSKGFDPDTPKHKWTNKTMAASNLFQSVLDEQQHFVTLGQVRQTIDKLMNDIAAMKCGELTRIMNHLQEQFRKDNQRCKNERVKYVEWLKSRNVGGIEDEVASQLTLEDADNDGPNAQDGARKRGMTKSKRMKNPALAFKHISKTKWTSFVDQIASNFQMNVLSTKIAKVVNNASDAKEDDEAEDDEEKKDDDSEGKKIIDAILDNTSFDIIKFEEVYQEQLEEQKSEEPKRKRKSIVKKKRDEVFDTSMSFCAGRITLQQLFSFSKSFRRFLRKNKIINEMLGNYDKIINSSSANQQAAIAMKKHRIPSKIEGFKEEYFGEDTTGFDAEVNYLFLGCENKYDLCHKIYPFWSGSIISDIYGFMESTEQIQGNYELKEAEFGQLKHSLNVNDELAIKLFHIIRFKIRTLTWKQIFNYFRFLLKMKYSVQKAIIKSDQAEDTTVSLDGIKLKLKIQLNDESVWLFNKVSQFHGSKVTWKQIQKYLKKTITVRDEMRDFFHDNARDREFDDNKAEIINGISDNVERNAESNEEKQEEILSQLASITKQLNKLQQALKTVNNQNNKNNKNDKEKEKSVGFSEQFFVKSKLDAVSEESDPKKPGDLKPIGDRFLSTPL